LSTIHIACVRQSELKIDSVRWVRSSTVGINGQAGSR
jgi:hypothetical protein